MSEQEEDFQAIVVDTVLQNGRFVIVEHSGCGVAGIGSSEYGWIRRDGKPLGAAKVTCLTCGAALALWWMPSHYSTADDVLDAWSRLS